MRLPTTRTTLISLVIISCLTIGGTALAHSLMNPVDSKAALHNSAVATGKQAQGSGIGAALAKTLDTSGVLEHLNKNSSKIDKQSSQSNDANKPESSKEDVFSTNSNSSDAAVYTDENGNPLSGEWRYQGTNYVFDKNGHIVAGGGTAGTKGRLYIPSVGIDVAVNRSTDADAQLYTDLEDSAAYMRYVPGTYYIADHNTQGFAGLVNVSCGDVAYLFTDAGIEAFTCTSTFTGHNTGTGLTDAAGNDLASQMPACGFTAYTCLDTWTNIQITFWERTWIASTTSTQPTVRLNRQEASDTLMENGDYQEVGTEEGQVRESIAMPGAPGGTFNESTADNSPADDATIQFDMPSHTTQNQTSDINQIQPADRAQNQMSNTAQSQLFDMQQYQPADTQQRWQEPQEQSGFGSQPINEGFGGQPTNGSFGGQPANSGFGGQSPNMP